MAREDNRILRALVQCLDELERLRSVLLPQYEDKVGEPNLTIINNGRQAIGLRPLYKPDKPDEPVSLRALRRPRDQ